MRPLLDRRGMDKNVDLRYAGAAVVGLGVIWITLGFYVAHAALVQGQTELPLGERLHLGHLFPEDWALFTIDARHEYPWVFARKGTRWISVDASYRNSDFGFDRASRAPNREASLLVGFLSDADWQPCRTDVTLCFDSGREVKVDNLSTNPRLCGNIAILLRSIPAWSNGGQAVHRPAASRFVKLDVSC
jgi:hypothetical protein